MREISILVLNVKHFSFYHFKKMGLSNLFYESNVYSLKESDLVLFTTLQSVEMQRYPGIKYTQTTLLEWVLQHCLSGFASSWRPS